MRRVALESARLAFALVVGLALGKGLESTCPAPTPENSSPGCEGLSLIYGGVLGFIGALCISLVAEWIWRRRRHGRAGAR